MTALNPACDWGALMAVGATFPCLFQGDLNGRLARLRWIGCRVSPTYPLAMDRKVHREGRACFPGVVSASQPEFGWAAATAINQWVFAPPTRDGEPVDALVNIPVDFAAPKG